MSRVLGIDPGTRVTGYGVVDMKANRLTHVAHGHITTRSSDSLQTRLGIIFKGINAVIEEHGPDEMGIETIFTARDSQAALKLGHARGVAVLAGELKGLEVTEYSALQVKSAVVGYGKAAKEQVQEMVRRLLALQENAGQDASDALAVAICHCQTRGTSRNIIERRVGRR